MIFANVITAPLALLAEDSRATAVSTEFRYEILRWLQSLEGRSKVIRALCILLKWVRLQTQCRRGIEQAATSC